jgi:hypothetical protein
LDKFVLPGGVRGGVFLSGDEKWNEGGSIAGRGARIVGIDLGLLLGIFVFFSGIGVIFLEWYLRTGLGK